MSVRKLLGVLDFTGGKASLSLKDFLCLLTDGYGIMVTLAFFVYCALQQSFGNLSFKEITHYGNIINLWLSSTLWNVPLWNYGKGPWSPFLLPPWGIFRLNGIDSIGRFTSVQCSFGLPQTLHDPYNESLSLSSLGNGLWNRDWRAGLLRRAFRFSIHK